MKSFIVFAVLVAAALAAPPSTSDKEAVIVKASFDNIGVDGYSYESETSNGISQQAEAVVKNPESEYPALEVRGQFAYTAPDGNVYQVSYIANENGFQPQGAHLPQVA